MKRPDCIPDSVVTWYARLSLAEQERVVSFFVDWRENRKAPGIRVKQDAGDDALFELIPPYGLTEKQLAAVIKETRPCYFWFATDWDKKWKGDDLEVTANGVKSMAKALGADHKSLSRRLKRLIAKGRLKKEGSLFLPQLVANAPREFMNLRDTEEPYDGIRDC